MKKMLVVLSAFIIMSCFGVAVHGSWIPAPQDVGWYEFAMNIHQVTIFTVERKMQFPAEYGVHNNQYITNSYCTTSIRDSYGTRATGTKRINSGDRLELSYWEPYRRNCQYGYRLCIANQSSYGNRVKGSWAPNDNKQY